MKDSQSWKKHLQKQTKKTKSWSKNAAKQTQHYYKKSENNLLLFIIPLIFIIILAILNKLNIQVVNQISDQRLSDINYSVQVHPYPLLTTFNVPDISAQTAIIMDANSQVVLYAKNPTLRFSMASTTKIMTALLGLDYYKYNSILTIKTPHIEGSNMGFYGGEKFHFQDLLYAMMLPSSNEAAYAVAENYPGGVKTFVQKMNEKARALHLTNTDYGDPIGLDDDQDFTTVIDLARLASIASQNPNLIKITSTKQKIITDLADNPYNLENLNKLLGIKGINGLKTGTTQAAGEVLVTSTVQNGHTFIIIVMRSQQRFIDTLNLISLLSNNVQYVTPKF